MDLERTVLAAVLVFGLAEAAVAQVDVDRLPLNLAKIQLQLRQSATRDESQGLNIRYVVDVFGRAPRIDFFTKEDHLQTGPVPYGGPTHREVLEVITPQEYRAPVADFTALLRWFAEQARKK